MVEDLTQKILNGEIKVTVKIVGCDFEHGVANIQGMDFNEYYSVLDKYGAYDPSEIYNAKEGEDVTELVKTKIQKALAQREEAAKQVAEMEGAIAFNRCWECGRVKIVGKIHNGHVDKMPKEEWVKAQRALEQAWKAMFTPAPTAPLSSAGTNWTEQFAKLGFKATIVNTVYDGC